MSQIAEMCVGLMVSIIILEVLRRMASGKEVVFGPVVKKSLQLFGRMISIGIRVSLRVGLKTLLLIVPGIVESCKLALAFPVAIFEDKHGHDALVASQEYMNGHKGKYFGYMCAVFWVYFLGFMGMYTIIPEDYPVIVQALSSVPVNMMRSLWIVGNCLFYADRAQNLSLARPVGTPDAQRPDYDELGIDAYSRKSWFTAIGISITIVMAALTFTFQQAMKTDYLTFGEQSHEIYFMPDVSTEAVERVAQHCLTNEFFQGNETRAIYFEFSEGEYWFYFYVSKDQWDDPDTLSQLNDLRSSLRIEVFQAPIQIFLYDEFLDEQIILSEPQKDWI